MSFSLNRCSLSDSVLYDNNLKPNNVRIVRRVDNPHQNSLTCRIFGIAVEKHILIVMDPLVMSSKRYIKRRFFSEIKKREKKGKKKREGKGEKFFGVGRLKITYRLRA